MGETERTEKRHAPTDAIRTTELQSAFQPNTSSKKSPSGSRPIWERLNERKNRLKFRQNEGLKYCNKTGNLLKRQGKLYQKQGESIFDRLHSQRLGGVRGGMKIGT